MIHYLFATFSYIYYKKELLLGFNAKATLYFPKHTSPIYVLSWDKILRGHFHFYRLIFTTDN